MKESGTERETPARIRVLPDAVINKIAAGEVVERPASVVKELMENALDAGAGQLSVTLADGGKTRISVLDDGCGMSESDARLSVERHATSKIRNASELERIQTLGFRGEALASIAAVSRFELTTCPGGPQGGFRLAMEGGEVNSTGRVGFPRGTKVVVEDLFCNIPARQKFLRSQATEFQHVQTQFTQLALANFGVRFRLTHNRRTVNDLPGCETLSERVYQLFGRELQSGMITVSIREGTLAFEGLISHPSHSRGSRRWQHLILNGRPIRDARVNHAVYQAYRTLLMKGRHPAYMLGLSIEPGEVDVNVHPTKTEVRLRNPNLVHTVLADRLHRLLMEHPRRQVWDARPGKVAWTGSPPLWNEGAAGAAASAQAAPDPAFPDSGPRPLRDQAAFPEASTNSGAATVQGASALSGAPLEDNPYRSEAFHFQPLIHPSRPDGGEREVLLQEDMEVLGQYHATYILAQRSGHLVLVDQHAAHERILFEQLRTQFYQNRPLSEQFLLPLTLEMSAQNALLLEQYLPQFGQLGFEIEPYGRHSFLVRQVPSLLKGKDLEALVLEVLDELALFGKSGRLEEVINEIMERVACHGAIRAGMILSREEMDALLAQLQEMDINLYCPHGRPVWIEFPRQELEKRFKRIV